MKGQINSFWRRWTRDFQVNNKKIGFAISALALIAIVWSFWDGIVELLQMAGDREAILQFVQDIGFWGPLILGVTIFLQMIVAAIPGHLLMVSAGFLYGFWPGFLFTWIITIIGGQFTFYLARVVGKPLVYKLAPPKLIDKWEDLGKYQGIVFYIFSFTVPIFPADVMCYVAGFATISSSRFLVANVVGHLPVAVLMNLAGAYGFELSTAAIVVIIVISIVMFIGWLKYKDLGIRQNAGKYDPQTPSQ